MKKIMFLLVMMAGMLSFTESKAQSGTAYTFPVIAGDSLATADTVFKKISVTAGYSSVGIQVDIKKGTGTLDGKFYLYKSVKGSNYVLSDSASFTAVPTHATLISNGGYTHTAVIEKVAPAGTSYIVAAVQTGSLTASPVRVSYTARKAN
jgi:hypothetical protein